MITVTANRDACQGHARCVAKAPDVFVLDDLGYNVTGSITIEESDEARIDAALAAQAACPERAITVEMP